MYKDIKWYEGIYQATDRWTIVNVKWDRWWKRKMSESKGWKWKNYLTISLYRNWIPRKFLVHRLIANTFIKNTDKLPCINHKNWIKTDNRVENLEWCTQKHNINESIRLWLFKWSQKWKFWIQHNRSRSVNRYTIDWKIIDTFESINSASKNTWVNSASICMCCKWDRKSAWWFKWEYKNTYTFYP